MSTQTTVNAAEADKKYRPYVPENMEMREFTFRAVLIGLVMTVILGAANAYLGLRAGMTIAATYPAAVIGMALLRMMKGSLLEENIARTVGSIGESVAAGAVFTLPAFVISGAWKSFGFHEAYWKSAALMAVGGALGILFVTLLRRVMVEDPELPFPESVAASQIHKAGQQGAQAAMLLFYNMGFGGLVFLLGSFQLFNASKAFVIHMGQTGRGVLRLGSAQIAQTVNVGGVTTFQAPAISPAYLGVGYIIGPRLAALNFAGGVVAWGLLVPLIIYFLGPNLQSVLPPGSEGNVPNAVWRFIVRPIAVGGMLVGAGWTLFRMRKSLGLGMKRAISDLKKSAAAHTATNRTERDLSGKVVFPGLAAAFFCMVLLYTYFSGLFSGGVVAALVMIVVGFFFAAVSGNLVGLIGSSNNPVSGLTLCTLIIAALLMVAIGVSGISGVAAVLGVAAVVCVSSAVAGEMLQDLKVGHILGGTPGNMPWPLVGAGILMGFAMILLEVKSVMLFAVGMYLPLETTFAIFVGGVIRWLTDKMRDKRGFNAAQKARVENAGVLTASGFIAGEAILGLVVAAFYFFNKPLPVIFTHPATISGFIVLVILALVMIRVPLANAGRPEDPAPPTAIM